VQSVSGEFLFADDPYLETDPAVVAARTIIFVEKRY
jgi:hypothetical protein